MQDTDLENIQNAQKMRLCGTTFLLKIYRYIKLWMVKNCAIFYKFHSPVCSYKATMTQIKVEEVDEILR